MITKSMSIDGRKILLTVWDTAGSERFQGVSTKYIRNAQACILMYDITSKESFDSVAKWVADIEQKGRDNIVVILVGNKKDMESRREVAKETGQAMAKTHGYKFFETSALQNELVTETFEVLIKELCKVEFDQCLYKEHEEKQNSCC